MIAIDNTLVEHSGKLIEDVGWFWDHADKRYMIAHDYLISNYVCPSGAHYPIEWRRFRKNDACEAGTFKDHTELCLELIDDAIGRDIPGDFTFDSYFTSAKILNHIQGEKRSYVGDLKLNRNVIFEVARSNSMSWPVRLALKTKRRCALVSVAIGISANGCAYRMSIIRCASCYFGESAGIAIPVKPWQAIV